LGYVGAYSGEVQGTWSNCEQCEVFCFAARPSETCNSSQMMGTLSKGVLLLHDSAQPHTATAMVQTVQQLGFELLPHPPLQSRSSGLITTSSAP
jgi:hypothetical protein